MRLQVSAIAALAFLITSALGDSKTDYRPGYCDNPEDYAVCCHKALFRGKIDCETPAAAYVKGHAGHMCPKSTYRQLYCCKTRSRDRRYYQCSRPRVFDVRADIVIPSVPEDIFGSTFNSTPAAPVEGNCTAGATSIIKSSPANTTTVIESSPANTPTVIDSSPASTTTLIESNSTLASTPTVVNGHNLRRRDMHPIHTPRPNPDAKRFKCPTREIIGCPKGGISSLAPKPVCCNPEAGEKEPRKKCVEAEMSAVTWEEPIHECPVAWAPSCCDEWLQVSQAKVKGNDHVVRRYEARGCNAPNFVK